MGGGAHAIWARYNAATDVLRLFNNAGTKLLGASCTPGVVGTLQNNQGKINCGATAATGTGNSLKVKLTAIPKAAFADASTPKQPMMNATDSSGATSGWKNKGSWTV
jgi:hypothetical protein